MSSVIIGKLTFMTCMVPAESALSAVTHHQSTDMVASEVHPLVYLLLAAGALAVVVAVEAAVVIWRLTLLRSSAGGLC
jgi:hypothetical protein